MRKPLLALAISLLWFCLGWISFAGVVNCNWSDAKVKVLTDPEVCYNWVHSAVEWAPDGSRIVLLQNVSLSKNLTVDGWKTLEIPQSKTLSVGDEWKVIVEDEATIEVYWDISILRFYNFVLHWNLILKDSGNIKNIGTRVVSSSPYTTYKYATFRAIFDNNYEWDIVIQGWLWDSDEKEYIIKFIWANVIFNNPLIQTPEYLEYYNYNWVFTNKSISTKIWLDAWKTFTIWDETTLLADDLLSFIDNANWNNQWYTIKWKVDGTNVNTFQFPYAEWKVISYSYQLNTYNITYNLNWWTNNQNNPATYNVTTSTITLQDPSKGWANFLWWFKESNFQTQVTTIPQGSVWNITLYAKWDNYWIPDDITFQPITNAELSTEYTSDEYTISWITQWVTFSIDKGEYKVNDWERTSTSSTVNNWDKITLKLMSPSTVSTTETMTITYWAKEGTFSITTRWWNCNNIQAFQFEDWADEVLWNTRISNEITVSWIDAGFTCTATVTNWQVKNKVTWVQSSSVTVSQWDILEIYMIPPTKTLTKKTATLTIWNQSADWNIYTNYFYENFDEETVWDKWNWWSIVGDGNENNLYVNWQWYTSQEYTFSDIKLAGDNNSTFEWYIGCSLYDAADKISVQISKDGTNYTTIWSNKWPYNPDGYNSLDYINATVSKSLYGDNVSLRLLMESDGSSWWVCEFNELSIIPQPSNLSFTATSNAEVGTWYTSNTVTISGLPEWSYVWLGWDIPLNDENWWDNCVSNATNDTQYEACYATYVDPISKLIVNWEEKSWIIIEDWLFENGDTFAIKLKSSSNNSATTKASITFDWLTNPLGTYTVTTKAATTNWWWWGGWWGWGGWTTTKTDTAKTNTGAVAGTWTTATTTKTDTNSEEKTDSNKDTNSQNNGNNNSDKSWYEEWNQSETLTNWYSREFNNAYRFAFRNKITTMDDISKADMNWPLNRIAMAKMLSNYAINILWKKPDINKKCSFPDVSEKLNSDYNDWVTLACQLGIMWVWIDKFRPYDPVNRGEFGTSLSRMLFGLADWTDNYYSTHLKELKKRWIISNDNPYLEELRWYVMLMLMRSAM